MPTSSSLVTNLPADFNTFGQAVDTSMSELKGGTTGQILSKTSATDMDFTWITNDVGDITAVTAGTGISGGGTSGSVTITNSMATEITAKGDLIVGTGSATFDNLAVGTNGMTIVADSSTATGLKWATASGGGKVLQVVTATYATETASSSITYADTGLTVTITPTLSTSKVYAIAVVGGLYKSNGSVNNAVNLKLLRASTSLITKTGYMASGSTAATQIDGTLSYLDSPATTSATIYKVQFANAVASAEVYVQNANNTSTIVLMEIGA